MKINKKIINRIQCLALSALVVTGMFPMRAYAAEHKLTPLKTNYEDKYKLNDIRKYDISSPVMFEAPRIAKVTTMSDLQNKINNSTGSINFPELIEIDSVGITLTNTLTVPKGKYVKLTGGTLTRSANFTGELIFVGQKSNPDLESVAGLTLENIIIEGNHVITTNSLVKLAYGSLIIEDGAVIRNGSGGGIELVNSSNKLVMIGGEITGNTASKGAGISDASYKSSLEIQGGEITNNTATGEYGGGVYTNGLLTISGGTISGNTVASGRGGGIYSNGGLIMSGGTIKNNTAKEGGRAGFNVYLNSNSMNLSGMANIPNGFTMDKKAKLYISSALQNSIEIEELYNNPEKDDLIATGINGYTITKEDMQKFSYKGDSFNFVLDSENKIRLSIPQYKVTYTLVNLTATNQPDSIDKDESLMTEIHPILGYKVPEAKDIVVKMNNKILAPDKYQVVPLNDGYGISISSVTGDVEIIMNAKKLSTDANLDIINCWLNGEEYLVLNSNKDLEKSATLEGYTITVPDSITEGANLKIFGIKSDENADVTFDEGTIGSTLSSLYITVTAEDKISTKTYRVNFQIPSFSVHFNTNSNSTIEQQFVINRGKVIKPDDPMKTGYIFKGWYKEENCTTLWDFSKDTVTEDMVLYAKWVDQTTGGLQTGDNSNLLFYLIISILSGGIIVVVLKKKNRMKLNNI